MFDPVGTFTRQFKPVDGGYVYYPGPKSGGKLVTAGEYQQLVAHWERTAGRHGQWKVAGIVIAIIALWTLVTQSMPLPDWTEWIIIGLCVVSITAWFFWASFAPRRLVRGRPDVAPPRLRSEVTREARASLNWRLVAFALLFSGVALISTLTSPERTLSWWAWLVGSSVFFALYAWVAIQKILDRQR